VSEELSAPPRIPFLDLTRALRAGTPHGDGVRAAVGRVVDSGWYLTSREGEAFEEEWAAYTGARAAVGVGSGSDAIELALRALGVGRDDEVIVPAFSPPVLDAPVRRTGAVPVHVDVDDATLLIDPAAARRAVTTRTRAVLAVHLYGRRAPVEELLELGPEVIEDGSHAHGIAPVTRVACFSFYPTKNLGALGDAGAVTFADAALADVARAAPRSRLDELQAAVLRARLPHLDDRNRARAAIAARYDDALGVRSPAGVHHLYVLRHPRRDEVRAKLSDRGIGTLVHYPEPLADAPVARRAAAEVLSLPCYPDLTDAEADEVAAAAGAAVS
jgi:dTDP-4-amino-4,6-dideoxygalactose transaminase